MSVDPLTEKYEDYTPYQFSSNQPVHAKELEGLESSNDLNKQDKTAWQRAYDSKTGNTDGLKLIVNFLGDINTYVREKIEPSDKDIGSTATSKNGGGENQKTTGEKKGDNISADPFLTGAPGSASKGNNLSKTKDYIKAVKDINSLFKKGQKVGDGVNEIIKENSKKEETKPKEMDMIYLVKDDKNPNNNVQVSREVFEAQQKKK